MYGWVFFLGSALVRYEASPKVSAARIIWAQESYLRGKHFGTEGGQLLARIRISYYATFTLGSPETVVAESLIPISDESIIKWSDTEIVLKFIRTDLLRLKEAKERASQDLFEERAEWFSIDYVIITKFGKRATASNYLRPATR
jgi:hypothetical protein